MKQKFYYPKFQMFEVGWDMIYGIIEKDELYEYAFLCFVEACIDAMYEAGYPIMDMEVWSE